MSGKFQVQNIVVPMDFSNESHRALAWAATLAEKAGPAHVILVHAYYLPPEIEAFAGDRVPSYLEALSEQATADLEKTLVGLQDQGISAEYVAERGSPDQVITRLAADKKADLIVMGTHGRTGLSRVALGSIAERVVQTAPCPVLTVKDEAR